MKPIRDIQIRRASEADEHRLRAFQAASLRMLAASDYSRPVVESFISQIGTMDRAMLARGRFFMLELHGELVGCGGWMSEVPSYLAFTNGSFPALPDGAATVHGVYVDPAVARRGIGSLVINLVEQDLRANGHTHAQLCSTRTGASFYLANGYRRAGLISIELPHGEPLEAVAMAKVIANPVARAA